MLLIDEIPSKGSMNLSYPSKGVFLSDSGYTFLLFRQYIVHTVKKLLGPKFMRMVKIILQ